MNGLMARFDGGGRIKRSSRPPRLPPGVAAIGPTPWVSLIDLSRKSEIIALAAAAYDFANCPPSEL
jgi:hypothetical protein